MVNHPYEGLEAILAIAQDALKVNVAAGKAAVDIYLDRDMVLVVELRHAERCAWAALKAALKAAAFIVGPAPGRSQDLLDYQWDTI